MKGIRGFLIDLDGVLYVGEQAVEGAQAAIDYLRQQEYPFRCMSNTTRKCRRTITHRLSAMGFDIPEEYIFTPPIAAVAYMKEAGKQRCYLLTTGDVEQDFNAIGKGRSGAKIDCVVIGDAGDTLTYNRLNAAFRYLVDGAELIALEKDRYWMAPDGLSLSAGPFVQALEFASGKTAAVMGKPSKSFFELALRDLGLRPDQVTMIGDDIITDIAGAQSIGMGTVLVRTGKYRKETLNNASACPTHILDSIADIKDVL